MRNQHRHQQQPLLSVQAHDINWVVQRLTEHRHMSMTRSCHLISDVVVGGQFCGFSLKMDEDG